MTTDLITRIEQAGESDQWGLLMSAFDTIFPAPGDAADCEQWNYDLRYYRKMLNAGAYLSAAEMLVPDGARFEFVGMEDGRGAARILWPGEASLPKLEPLCATPALALAAACMKAYGEMQS